MVESSLRLENHGRYLPLFLSGRISPHPVSRDLLALSLCGWVVLENTYFKVNLLPKHLQFSWDS